MNMQISYTELTQNTTPETDSAYDEGALVALASDLNISDEDQARLAAIGSPSVREALAANPCLNEIQQSYLAATGSLAVKCKLAKNPSLINVLQEIFAESNVSEVRESLAENRKLNPTCQTLLMQDKDELGHKLIHTLIPLASNPALTTELQQALAASGECSVVASLAKNPSISESMIEQLAEHEEDEIRAGLASNTRLSEPMQAQLIASGVSKVLENIARNPALKVAQQALLAYKGSFVIRLALLENCGLDAQLRKLVSSSFEVSELNRAELDLEHAESRSARLIDKYRKAVDKCIKTDGGFFSSSDEKIERLNKEADRIQAQIDVSDREISRLTLIVSKLREQTKDLPAMENGIINYFRSILAA